MEREVCNAYSSGSDLSAAKRYLFFSGLWTAGYPLLFTCEQLERNLHDIVIVAGINELKSCFRALLSECFIINSVSVARWTKVSIWHEKKAQIFVRGYNLLRCEQLFRGGVLSLPLRWIVVRYFLVFSLVSKYRNKYLATVFVTASKHSRDVFAKGARSSSFLPAIFCSDEAKPRPTSIPYWSN